MERKKCSHNNGILKHIIERLRALFDGIDEPIYVSDPNTYEILFANKKLEELVGKKILGRKCYKVFQDLNRPCTFCPNKYILEENLGKTHIWEHQNRRNKHWYRCMDKAIEWPEGKYVRFGMAIDITEHKHVEKALRESEELFRSVVENSHVGILIIDDDFRITFANDEIERIGGRPKAKIIGQDFRKFLGKEEKPLAESLYLRRQNGEKVPSCYEFSMTREDGEKRDVEVKSATIRDSAGRVHTVVQIIDITERKKSEDRIRESEEKYRNLFQNAGDVILTFDLKGNVTSVNRAITEYGFKEDKLIGKNLLKFVPKKYWPRILKELAKIAQGNPVEAGIEINTPKGKKIAEYRSNPIKRGNKVIGLQTILRDVTERKRFEERFYALNMHGQNLNRAESLEEIYSLTLKAMEKTLGFEYASFMITEGKVLRIAKYCGYPEQLDLKLQLDGQRGLTVKAAKTGKPVYVPDVRKQKAYFKGGVKGMRSELAVPVKVGHRVLGVLNVESKRLAAFDENDRKLLETLASHAAIAMSDVKRHEQLTKLTERLEYLMKNTTQIMHAKHMYQRLKVITKAIRKFGWRRVVISLRDEKLEGTDLVTAGLTREETKLLLERKASGRVWRERLGTKFERFKIGEFYYLPWSEPWIREHVHKVPPEAPLDEATTYAGVPSKLSPEEMVDWHPQDMLYAPLRTPEGRIVGILSMDDPLDGRKPTRESLAPLELFLHQAAMVIENAQLVESLKEARQQLEAYAEHLEQKVEERTRELKKSQKQLLKAQRFAVIGELAGMVGHDLRNPLTSINGAAYYLKKRLGSKIDGKVKEMLILIERNIGYSNKIINDLLDYSREIKLDLAESNPESIIKDALSLVEIPKNVKVMDLTESEPKMRVDVGKIKRAFVNIIKNAVEAMPNGGTLTIKGARSDGDLVFVFSDTGFGMSKRTMTKLWTPLFTTKAKGMGFGLAISKRIVEAHGGSISVKSARGKGTTFTLIIPIKSKIEGGEKIWVKPLESSLLTTMKT